MSTLTYTFPTDFPTAELRGVTVTGGEFCRLDGQWMAGEPDAVRFATKVNGKAIGARIAGKPELEAALAAHQAAQAAKAACLRALGWDEYREALRAAGNAEARYDAASEHGYPVREAERLRQAQDALSALSARSPGAAAYAKAEAYSQAANADKAILGTEAMRAIEQGLDPIITVEAMEQAWHAAAAQAVDHA